MSNWYALMDMWQMDVNELKEENAKLKARGKVLEGVKDAAQILFDVANIQNWREDRQCPHGNSTHYPVHGWWCDECWFALGNALKKLEDTND